MSVSTQTREADQEALKRSRRPAFGKYELSAVPFIMLAAVLRIWLVALGPPRMDSDEGTMGLMALHIAYHGEHPVFFYGQSYMGALEAYLAAGMFRLFGVSDFTLRLGLILLAALFQVVTYLLVRLLYDRRLALVSVALLSPGSQEIISRQLKAVGGYPELLLLGAVILLLASWLAISPRGENSRRRLLAYAGWGLTAGLGIWSDPLILPFVVVSGLLLLLSCRSKLRPRVIACMAMGFLAGVLPLLIYNLSATPGNTTLSSISQIYRAGGTAHTSGAATTAQRIAGTLLVSVPVLSGGNGICSIAPQDAWPLSARSSASVVRCTVVHGIWGASFIALWLAAVLISARSILRARRVSPVNPSSETARGATARQWARLALLGSAGLSLALFIASPAPARAPWYNVRYLTGLWLALPAIVAPLVAGTPRVPRALLLQACRWALLAILGVALVLDTTHAFADTPYVQWLNWRQQVLIADLLRLKATHIYSDYWTCDRLMFESRERVICAALDSHLRPSLDRYLLYRLIVRRDRQAAYVFVEGSAQAEAFARGIAFRGNRYRRTHAAGYVVYQPVM